ncbi:hypothetical protein [Sulfitobacter noctilucae]|uniref:hypothetical protein n=1 Tax=Sulfitobacter noctilucae TaxID=1342302 RepID=UPI00046903A4|nr:hypothetical protein [Sulfitobacter noctilucae]
MTSAEREALHRRMDAEICKLIAGASKIASETRWYPFVVGSGVTLVIVAAVKLFLKRRNWRRASHGRDA